MNPLLSLRSQGQVWRFTLSEVRLARYFLYDTLLNRMVNWGKNYSGWLKTLRTFIHVVHKIFADTFCLGPNLSSMNKHHNIHSLLVSHSFILFSSLRIRTIMTNMINILQIFQINKKEDLIWTYFIV